ncbi:Metallo-dependent phosphatase-like protein [Aspergillus karnatakaensis]|uniref:Metallo-dependent phosphatase-like protein n=1 Tax=Aspergillus karnatakaensis TaxID=1810916 RepID=UPI003CCCF0EF
MKFLNPFKAAPVIAASAVVAKANYPALPDDLTTPFQQRLAIYGPNSVSIGWNTYTKLDESCVEYGTSSASLDQRSCASTGPTTYPSSRTYENVVILTELAPGTTYYYQIVSGNSTVDQFLSPRSPGDETPFAINAVIDLGVYGEDGYTIANDHAKRDIIPTIPPALNHTTIGRLASTVSDYDFVIHPGDFAYADDWFLNIGNLFDGLNAYQAILENFYTQLAPIAGRKPYMASPGNHEAACQEIPFSTGLCPAGQKNFTDFMHRFGNTMPDAFPSVSSNYSAQVLANKARQLAEPPFWYSFEYGMAHIVMINTETDFEDAPSGQGGSAGLNGGPFGTQNQQLEFLEADLASVDRDITPWVIVAGHRPWYTAGLACKPCQEAFEDLFFRYGVDIGVFGHVHNSQRFVPIYNSAVDPKGMDDPKAPMYIVSGAAGNIEGLVKASSKPEGLEWVNDEVYAYANIRFLDRTRVRVDFIESTTGETLDSSTLVKSHSERFVRQEA